MEVNSQRMQANTEMIMHQEPETLHYSLVLTMTYCRGRQPFCWQELFPRGGGRCHRVPHEHLHWCNTTELQIPTSSTGSSKQGRWLYPWQLGFEWLCGITLLPRWFSALQVSENAPGGEQLTRKLSSKSFVLWLPAASGPNCSSYKSLTTDQLVTPLFFALTVINVPEVQLKSWCSLSRNWYISLG